MALSRAQEKGYTRRSTNMYKCPNKPLRYMTARGRKYIPLAMSSLLVVSIYYPPHEHTPVPSSNLSHMSSMHVTILLEIQVVVLNTRLPPKTTESEK